jgi:hypothetical protein
MPRPPQRTKHGVVDRGPVRDDAIEHALIDGAVGAKRIGGARDGAIGDRRAAAIERMCEHHRRLQPVHAMLAKRHRAEYRRRDGEGVDGGAHVVDEPGQRQRRGSAAAADRVRAFQDEHLSPRSGDHDRRGEAVRT